MIVFIISMLAGAVILGAIIGLVGGVGIAVIKSCRKSPE